MAAFPQFARYVFALWAAGAVLAGCGGAGPLSPFTHSATAQGPTPTLPMSGGAKASHPDRGPSWTRAGAKTKDLLYVSNQGADVVYVYSWPRAKLVGQLTGFVQVAGVCVDSMGNVWVVNEGRSEILEYAHGGTTPIATLSDPGEYPVGCSVDPTTGNLAVMNIESTHQGHGSVAIYADASGTPVLYTDSRIFEYYFCGYDGTGNLYLDGRPTQSSGFAFAELLKGKSTLRNVTLNQSIGAPGGVQWDGAHVAVGDQLGSVIYQFAVRGRKGTKVGSTPLDDSKDVVEFWIQQAKVIGPDAGSQDVPIWNYPAGGTPTKTIYGQNEPVGATVSDAE